MKLQFINCFQREGDYLGTSNGNPNPSSLCHSLVLTEPQQQGLINLLTKSQDLLDRLERISDHETMTDTHKLVRIESVMAEFNTTEFFEAIQYLNQRTNDERNATQQQPNHGAKPLYQKDTLVQQNVGEGEGTNHIIRKNMEN